MSTEKMEVIRKRKTLAPNTVIVTKSSSKPRMSMGIGGSSTMYRRSNITHLQSVPNVYQQGEAIKVSKEAVQNVKGVRGKEKNAMCHLNGVLAEHMENARFLQVTNKALADECEQLRKLKGLDQTRVQQEYEDEITEAREALALTAKQLAPLSAANVLLEDKIDTQDEEISALRKQIEELNGKINKLSSMLGDMEGETISLRKQCECISSERDTAKDDLQRCRNDNDRLRQDYEEAITKQINAENERQAIDSEYEFLKETTDLEIEELRRLLAKFKEMQPQIAGMWKSEFQKVVTDLQQQFNERLEVMSEEQRIRYEEKLAQAQLGMRRTDGTDGIVKSENRTLKSQLGDNKMRLSDLETENDKLKRMYQLLKEKYDEECRECEQEKAEKDAFILELQRQLAEVMEDVEELKDGKMGLQLEIACYQKLLEGEENKIQHALETHGSLQTRGGAALASVISGGLSDGQSSGGGSQMSQSSSMSQSFGTVRVSRTSKCSLVITEIDQAGQFISVKNGSTSKEFDLSGWTMERKCGSSNKTPATFDFPSGFKLKPSGEVRIYSHTFSEDCGSGDLVANQKSCRLWGVGNGTVKIFDTTHTMKCVSEITFQKE